MYLCDNFLSYVGAGPAGFPRAESSHARSFCLHIRNSCFQSWTILKIFRHYHYQELYFMNPNVSQDHISTAKYDNVGGIITMRSIAFTRDIINLYSCRSGVSHYSLAAFRQKCNTLLDCSRIIRKSQTVSLHVKLCPPPPSRIPTMSTSTSSTSLPPLFIPHHPTGDNTR